VSIADLIDESHFSVRIQACPTCGQRFLSVFTETIDWQDGDDDQYWSVLPITMAEGQALDDQNAATSETQLPQLAPQRRSLSYDSPTGKAPRVYWHTGVVVHLHD
jgi:hypothetical protein